MKELLITFGLQVLWYHNPFMPRHIETSAMPMLVAIDFVTILVEPG